MKLSLLRIYWWNRRSFIEVRKRRESGVFSVHITRTPKRSDFQKFRLFSVRNRVRRIGKRYRDKKDKMV